MVLIAFGIVICILVSFLPIFCQEVNTEDKIESTLKIQLIVSTILLVGVIYLAAVLTYPSSFTLALKNSTISGRTPLHAFLCSILGLVAGLIIAAFT